MQGVETRGVERGGVSGSISQQADVTILVCTVTTRRSNEGSTFLRLGKPSYTSTMPCDPRDSIYIVRLWTLCAPHSYLRVFLEKKATLPSTAFCPTGYDDGFE